MSIVDNMNWGGSGIEKVVYDFILQHVPTGSTIVEFGGGDCSTRVLGENYNLYTIEHDNRWLNHIKYTTYIHAPIDGEWYDRDCLEGKLPTDIKMIFIDGPSGGGFWLRPGLLKNLDLFGDLENTMFLLHDTWREPDKNLASELAAALDREVVFYEEGTPKDYWAFIK